MRNENKTLADWPAGVTGKTVDGRDYRILGSVRHDNSKHAECMIVYIWENSFFETVDFYRPDCSIFVHPVDEKVSIVDDLSNPGKVPVCRLDKASREALDAIGLVNIEFWDTKEDRWAASTLFATGTRITDHINNSSDVVYRARPQPKMRLMTQSEACAWAARQPESVIVSPVDRTFPYPAKNLSYDAPIEEYRWVDVDKGGGWKPLPMVED